MDRWSLGTLIWMPIFVILLIICLVITVGAFVWWRRNWDSYGSDDALGFSIGAAIVAVLLIAGTAWGMWPYKTEYHKWIETSGTVEQIESRIMATDSGPTERYVVTLDNGNIRSCDDSRCTQIEEGDELTLMCKRDWQWAGEHGYSCNYVSHQKK